MMFSPLQRMRQMDPKQPTISPTTLLILHLKLRRRSKRNSLHSKNKMRRRRSMVTEDSTASKSPPRTTACAINLRFPMQHVTSTSALRRQRSPFASSPGQNPSSERKPRELTSKHGHNLHLNSVSEEIHSDHRHHNV